MSSATAIKLTAIPVSVPSSRLGSRPAPSPLLGHVLQASRIADSTVPDGGYGWGIVAGGAVLLWWAAGTTYALGDMQTALVEDGLASPAVLSFIGSLATALISALALVSSRLMFLVGPRMMAMLRLRVVVRS